MANNDYAVTVEGMPVIIPLLANDTVSGCTSTPGIERNPGNGSFNLLDTSDTLRYEPDPGFTGYDTIAYSLACGQNSSLVYIYIYVDAMPDNINTAKCFVDPQSMEWGIREVQGSSGEPGLDDRLHNFCALTVGDLDQSDTTLTIGFMDFYGTENEMKAHGYQTHGLKIFYYDKTEQRVKFKNTIPFADRQGTHFLASTFGTPAIARYDNRSYIVVVRNHATELLLYAFDTNGACIWESNATYTDDIDDYFTTIVNIADFNRDGIPEVYTGKRIFSLATGELLCNGGLDSTGMTLSDFNNDTISGIIYRDEHALYIIDGNTSLPHAETVFPNVYSHTLREAPVVADIDYDGQAEIIVTGRRALTDEQKYNGYIRVFKSDGTPWAPARRPQPTDDEARRPQPRRA
jgi:hypothetical protein